MSSIKIASNSRVIIEAIDALRTRKARPDETRICHWIERRYGLKKEDIIKSIEDSVSDGSVLRVKYKEDISYRNPAKFTRFVHPHVSKLSAPLTVAKRILRVLRQLTRTDASQKEGASVPNILKSLHGSKQLLNYNEAHLERILTRSTVNGTVLKLPNGNYLLAGAKRIIARRPGAAVKMVGNQVQSVKMGPSAAAGSSTSLDTVVENSVETRSSLDTLLKRPDSDTSLAASDSSQRKKKAQPVPVMSNLKRARPMSKRKKFKKSMGPDFIEPADIGMPYLQESFEPKCDFCQYTASSNGKGVPEDLLICKDCDAKAHPSCMQYSEELATRIRRSPWQCMECKTCANCNDSGDWDFMLFCDMCDKGYHNECHEPPLTKKPSGKWVCSHCQTYERRRAKSNAEDANDQLDDKASTSSYATDFGEASSISEEMLTKTKPIIGENVVLRHMVPNPKQLFELNPSIPVNPQAWSIDDVESFLTVIGFPDQAPLFKEQEIDGISLLLLKRMDVLTGLSMKLGPALKIFGHLQRLQTVNSSQM
ncbi:Histone acetyltransferase KAT6A [Halotydeus destructor]|nr:Histone acetyltransferase KAT6A [Halotydeus destructor]